MEGYPKYLEFKDKTWHIVKVKEYNEVTVSFDYRGNTNTLEWKDLRLASLRQNTERMEGCEYLLSAENFMDFEEISKKLINFIENPYDFKEIIDFAAGELYFAVNQMLGVNYEDYSYFLDELFNIIEIILKLFSVLLRSEIVFVDKDFAKDPEQAGQIKYVSKGWQELTDLINSLFYQDSNNSKFYRPNSNRYFHSKFLEWKANPEKLSYRYANYDLEAIMKLFKPGTSLRFVYSMEPLIKTIFTLYNFSQCGLSDSFSYYLESLNPTALREYNPNSTYDFLQILSYNSYDFKTNEACAVHLVFLNIQVLKRSQKLIQMINIIDFLAEILNVVFTEGVQSLVKSQEFVLSLFHHENTLKRSKSIFEKLLSHKLLSAQEIINIIKNIKDEAIVDECIQLFSSLSALMDTIQNRDLLIFIKPKYKPIYKNSIIDIGRALIGKSIDNIGDLIYMQDILKDQTAPIIGAVLLTKTLELKCLSFAKMHTCVTEIDNLKLEIIEYLVIHASQNRLLWFQKYGLPSTLISLFKKYELSGNQITQIFSIIKHVFHVIPNSSIETIIKIALRKNTALPIIYSWVKEGLINDKDILLNIYFGELPQQNYQGFAGGFLFAFKIINEGHLQFEDDYLYRRIDSTIEGEEQLIKVYLNCELEEFEYVFLELITAIYTKFLNQNISINSSRQTLYDILSVALPCEKHIKLIKSLMWFNYGSKDLKSIKFILNNKELSDDISDELPLRYLAKSVAEKENLDLTHVCVMIDNNEINLSRKIKDCIGFRLEFFFDKPCAYHCPFQPSDIGCLLENYNTKAFMQDLIQMAKLTKHKYKKNCLYTAISDLYSDSPSFDFSNYICYEIILQLLISKSNQNIRNYLKDLKDFPNYLYQLLIASEELLDNDLPITNELLELYKDSDSELYLIAFDALIKPANEKIIDIYEITIKILNEYPKLIGSYVISKIPEYVQCFNFEKINNVIYQIAICEHESTLSFAFDKIMNNPDLSVTESNCITKNCLMLMLNLIFNEDSQQNYFDMGNNLNAKINNSGLNNVKRKKIMPYILESLFPENSTKILHFKSPITRIAAFKLLFQEKSKVSILSIYKNFKKRMETAESYKKSLANLAERVSYYHKGLKNFGSTCYINSSLQLLFSIEEFKDFILRKHTKPSSDGNSQ